MDNQEYEIDLREYFLIIRKRFWLIALVVIIATAATGVYSYFYLDKVYEASTKLIITKQAESGDLQYNDIILNQRLVKTYSEIAKSRTISDTVIRNLRLNISHGEFAGKIQVASLRDTEVIEIRVQDTNPNLAATIANELSIVFIDKIVNLMKIENIQILDTAIVPNNHISPRPKLNIAIAMVLGFMVGLGLVIVVEFLDNTIKNSGDVEKHLNLPVMATIPEIKEKGYGVNLVTYRDPKSPISEAYRMLRTNLQFSDLDKKLKTIVVTSTSPSEGKSTTIANLAITLVSMGSKTLLIDCDFRKPRIHTVFNISNHVGMTNYLMGEKLEDVIQRVRGLNLDILACGPIPPNPSELLASTKMKYVLQELRTMYDVILIDTPPVGLVTDGAILSNIADGTLYVVSSGETQVDNAQKAKKQLDKVNSNIIGVLLNKVKMGKREYRSYYQYYSSGE